METLIGFIERGKPFFDKVAANRYLKSIKDGFISAMPIVIFSSIFLLVAYVPNVWGFHWPAEVESVLTKPYNYSMSIISLVVAATTAKHFTDALNRDMPRNNQINFISTMIAALVGFLILSSDTIAIDLESGSVSGFNSAYLGSKGLLTAFLTTFVVGGFYKLCIGHNITIKMPEEVPPNISQTFKDIIPFGVSVIFFWLFDLIVRMASGDCFAALVISALQPFFTAADSYVGLAVIFGAMSLFWFVGVHGPSIVEPAIEVALLNGVAENLAAAQAGQQATHVLALSTQYFVVTLGGTGATLMACAMFAFMARSKEMRAVGKASLVPVFFGVNEPFLFGAPMILNPVFFIPFVLAPIGNIWLFKVFVDFLGMNAMIYTLPWTTPAPIGIVLGTGVDPLSFLFVLAVLAWDFAVYYPFFKVYDKEMCEQEREHLDEEAIAAKAARMTDAFQGRTDASTIATADAPAGREADPAQTGTEAPQGAAQEGAGQSEAIRAGDAQAGFTNLNGKKVLVLCQGGGTSGLLANALAKAAREHGLDLETAAGAYGAHLDIMGDFDLVVMAPQVASYYDDLRKDADRLGVAAVATQGKQYIDLTRDGEASLRFVEETLFERA